MQVNSRELHCSQFAFPLRHYHGLTIGFDIDEAEDTLLHVMEGFSVDIKKLREKFCPDNKSFIMRAGKQYLSHMGQYPVISLSFANVKESTYKAAVWQINQIITNLYHDNRFLLEGDFLSEEEKNYIKRISPDMPEVIAFGAIHQLSRYLFNYYHKKVIILLDEYDTPMQEAYMNGYWGEIVSFIRNMFNAAFKTNPYLERSVMTGITRVSKESIFSDLNKLEVVTATSER